MDRYERIAAIFAAALERGRLSGYSAKLAARDWRAKERAQHVKPVSDKVAFYSPKVDAVAAVKPRGRGK